MPPINKIIASPIKLTTDLEEELRRENVQFLNIETGTTQDFFQHEDSFVVFEDYIYSKIVAAFSFLSSCYLFEKKWIVEEEKTRTELQEAPKAKEIIAGLQVQSEMEKVNASTITKTYFGSLYVWLDPVQQEIMNDKNPRQVIIGPASTGKTLLIQLKVLQLCKNERDCHILIILPHKTLIKKYQQFFQQAEVNLNNVFFVTPSDDWKMVLEEKKHCHWFIDELVAIHIRCKNLNDIILMTAKEFGPQQVLWVTIDFAQKFNSLRPHLDHDNPQLIDGASKSHLMLIHRCTNRVFREYSILCRPFVEIGHQVSISSILYVQIFHTNAIFSTYR